MFSKSIFSSRTFWAMLAPAIAAWLGYLQGTVDLQAAIGATVMALIGMAMRLVTNGPVHIPGVTDATVATQASAAAPVVKQQAGFARIALLALVALTGVMLVAACQTLGISSTPTLDKKLAEAESVATAALSLSSTLLGNHTITLAQDQTVRKSHDVVVAAAHTAHVAIAAGDPAKAQAEYDAIAADLALLQSFTSSH